MQHRTQQGDQRPAMQHHGKKTASVGAYLETRIIKRQQWKFLAVFLINSKKTK